LAWILSPAWLTTAAVWLLRDRLDGGSESPLWAWVALVLCIDVAHVYSTVFRTYLDPSELGARRPLLAWIPLGGWVVGVLLHSWKPLYFWRGLAYLAVYHFMRQQYGFLRLYARRERSSALGRAIERAFIHL